MSRPYFLIDGYNLMHAGGMARRTYAPGQLDRCRSQLLRFLATRLNSAERERTTVVFDAGDAPSDLPRRMMFEGMTVLFAAPGKEADDTIEELIAAHASPRQVRLISGDHRLQRAARKRRGSFSDSDDFVQELDRRPAASDAPPPIPPRENTNAVGTETEMWLRVFGELPDAAAEEHGGSPIDQDEIAAIEEEIDREDVDTLVARSRRARKER